MASNTAAGRHISILASCVIVGTLLATFSTGACSSDDTGATADASSNEAAVLLCDTFKGSGKPCSPVSDQRCFSMCATGGCKCVAGNGGGVWQCTVDESCYPGGPDFDAATDEGGLIGDAGTTTDGATESGSDGGNDAQLGDAGDASDQ